MCLCPPSTLLRGYGELRSGPDLATATSRQPPALRCCLGKCQWISTKAHLNPASRRSTPLSVSNPPLCSVLSRRIIRQSLKYWQIFIQHIFRSIEKTFRADKVPCFVIHQFFMSRISRFLNMKPKTRDKPCKIFTDGASKGGKSEGLFVSKSAECQLPLWLWDGIRVNTRVIGVSGDL